MKTDLQFDAQMILEIDNSADYSVRDRVSSLYIEIIRKGILRTSLGTRYTGKLKSILMGSAGSCCFLCEKPSRLIICPACSEILKAVSEGMSLESANSELLYMTERRPVLTEDDIVFVSDKTSSPKSSGSLIFSGEAPKRSVIPPRPSSSRKNFPGRHSGNRKRSGGKY